MYSGLHVQCPLFLSDFNSTWIFSTDLKKNSNIKFHADGQTDRQKNGQS